MVAPWDSLGRRRRPKPESFGELVGPRSGARVHSREKALTAESKSMGSTKALIENSWVRRNLKHQEHKPRRHLFETKANKDPQLPERVLKQEVAEATETKNSPPWPWYAGGGFYLRKSELVAP